MYNFIGGKPLYLHVCTHVSPRFCPSCLEMLKDQWVLGGREYGKGCRLQHDVSSHAYSHTYPSCIENEQTSGMKDILMP